MTTREPVPADEWGEAEEYFLGQVIIHDADSIGYFRANAALTWLAEARALRAVEKVRAAADPPLTGEPLPAPGWVRPDGIARLPPSARRELPNGACLVWARRKNGWFVCRAEYADGDGEGETAADLVTPTDPVQAYMQTVGKMLCARAAGDKSGESRYFRELDVMFEMLTDEQDAEVRRLTRIVYGPPLTETPAADPPAPRTYPLDALILMAVTHGLGGAIVGGALAGPWGIIPGAILGALIGLGAARPHGDAFVAPIPDRPLPKPPDPPPPPPLG